MSTINAKTVAKYVIMPGIIPRVKGLFASGFGTVAFLMAHVYAMVRLLPNTHPYLNKHNIGEFGIRHVIGEAANHLIIKKENWDQILIFTILITGFVLLIAQIALVVVAALFEPVFAQGVSSFNGSLFATPNPTEPGATHTSDIAFILLDRVFGIPGFFCTVGNMCTDVLVDGRWPFHIALHSMLQFYSTGLLIVAVLIFLYFIVVIVGETATSGSPFGERFQNLWVPIRLVMALGLLIPINNGLNTGQYLGLYVAKTGSSLATNGWNRFNDTICNKTEDINSCADVNPIGERETLLAMPAEPDIAPLVQFMSLVHGCAYIEWREDRTIKKDSNGDPELDSDGNYVRRNAVDPNIKELDKLTDFPPGKDFHIQPYFAKNPSVFGEQDDIAKKGHQLITKETKYVEGLDFYNNSDIVIVFGEKVENSESNYPGDIKPTCGKLSIKISDLSHRNSANEISDINTYGGAPAIQKFYFELVQQMWFGEQVVLPDEVTVGRKDEDILKIEKQGDKLLQHLSHRYAEFSFGAKIAGEGIDKFRCKIGCDPAIEELPSCKKDGQGQYPCEVAWPDKSTLTTNIIVNYQAYVNTMIKVAHEKYAKNGLAHKMTPAIKDKGWAGAAIWYNTISQINGSFVNAVFGTPAPVTIPMIMEETRNKKIKVNPDVSGKEVYKPVTKDGKPLDMIASDLKKSESMYKLFDFWNSSKISVQNENKGLDGNPIVDVMNFIFGTHGIFTLRGENAHVHPLAQLSMVGKGIVNSAIQNLAISTSLSVLGGPIASFDIPIIGSLASMGASLFSTTAFIGLTAGVVLFYILPMLPFIFFFFAVAGWVKALFEAMVGIPLWALGHMRIDGEGLPGDAATNGYFLLFEIFLRPILIVFGLVAATTIFSAQARTLNFIWDMVVSNVGGIEETSTLVDTSSLASSASGSIARDVVDQFFYTIIYTIVIYMMASASFKLIDMIPDSIMRWAGNQVSAFGESDKNPAESLQRYAGTGGMVQGRKLIQAVETSGKEGGNVLREIMSPSSNRARPPPTE